MPTHKKKKPTESLYRAAEQLVEMLKESSTITDSDHKTFTTAEMSKMLGVGAPRTREILREAIELGFCEFVGRSPQQCIDGIMRAKPVYRLLEKEGTKKRRK